MIYDACLKLLENFTKNANNDFTWKLFFTVLHCGIKLMRKGSLIFTLRHAKILTVFFLFDLKPL